MVEAVFLFCSKNMVLTPHTGKSLVGFQNQMARQQIGWLTWPKPDRKLTYISSASAREEAGFQTMEEYIRQHKNIVAQ